MSFIIPPFPPLSIGTSSAHRLDPSRVHTERGAKWKALAPNPHLTLFTYEDDWRRARASPVIQTKLHWPKADATFALPGGLMESSSINRATLCEIKSCLLLAAPPPPGGGALLIQPSLVAGQQTRLILREKPSRLKLYGCNRAGICIIASEHSRFFLHPCCACKSNIFRVVCVFLPCVTCFVKTLSVVVTRITCFVSNHFI